MSFTKKTMILCTVLCGLVLGFSQTASAQKSVYKVQSLYLYNFAKYIQWDEIGDKYVIGIFANADAFDELEAVLKPRQVNGKQFEIIKLKEESEMANCHIVFIDDSHAARLRKASDLNLDNTLVVTASDQTSNGSNISFVVVDNKMKFKIDLGSCEKKSLTVSNNLIALGV